MIYLLKDPFTLKFPKGSTQIAYLTKSLLILKFSKGFAQMIHFTRSLPIFRFSKGFAWMIHFIKRPTHVKNFQMIYLYDLFNEGSTHLKILLRICLDFKLAILCILTHASNLDL